MVSNVDFYVAGFDAAGKRIGSLIFNGKPSNDKDVAAGIEKGKAAFEGAAVVEVISADDYGLYLSGEYVRGPEGKPIKYVAPEPTAEEKAAAQKAALKAEYEAGKAELLNSLQAAQLAGNADAVTSIQAEYKEFAEAYKQAVEEVG
ncbi:hypothetical protein [Acidaminococcus fermentans]|uniref:hypothetical protein n=1 Tax=Acidaminococcus fermentans TaxID=905 RepID=UPI00242E7BC2|nr:hypothetical protein [Acidaminococcus fermentans]